MKIEEIKPIYPDLTMHSKYLDGKTKTRYGWELQNTVNQIKFRDQYPILDYQFAYDKLLALADKEKALLEKTTIYFTRFYDRLKGKPGSKVLQILDGKVIYDSGPNWGKFKSSKYITKKSVYLKHIITSEDAIRNYFHFGEIVDFTK